MKPNLRHLFPAPADEVDLDLLEASLEAPKPKPEDYDNRNGYQALFLNDADPEFAVALPLLADGMVPVERAPEGREFELRYWNFSVVMKESRRMCCITGVNIDGRATFFHPKRPGWRTDPRIPLNLQVGGAEFYVPTDFDRGHMVRRLDPVWGEESDALLANADTHHYTNSCPQVHSFNDQTWGDLEDWILSQEQTRNSQACVFTGPIFKDEDPVYQGVPVPVRFFKVVVVVDDVTSRLAVTAFVMDQSSVMPPPDGVEEAVPEAAFSPGTFTHEQVTLASLQEETGLDFSPLEPFDVLASFPVPESVTTGPVSLPLTTVRDAVLWAS